ncbi:hypothetical protein PHMEG_00015752 [Phytophthora megakarya]|uniref:Retroviral polymerase SH3-like domain-containing protein n=1 Tax=Phytophthora megakarya TaxID=4795 RepID=A0A225W234_9STRA|nr:hypothetical protein PHMEG_00015752 [Phytophthora megakarya]
MDSTGKRKVNGIYGSFGHRYALAVFRFRRLKLDDFQNNVVSTLCSDLGLEFQSSNVESQGENGSAERAHRTMMGGVRCALRECKLLGFSSKYKGYRLLEVETKKYLLARDVKFSTTITDAVIRLSFPINNYTNDLEEEMLIQNLVKRSRGNIEVEVPTQGEDMSSESLIRSPTSQSLGVANGDSISPELVTRPSTSPPVGVGNRLRFTFYKGNAQQPTCQAVRPPYLEDGGLWDADGNFEIWMNEGMK